MSANVPPPEGGRAPVRLYRVPSSGVSVVTFLGPLEGSLEHWHRGRSVPCDGPGHCPAAVHSQRTVYYAYAPAEVFDVSARSWRPFVFQATSNLEELLRGRKLRGEVWSLSRSEHKEDKGAVTGAFLETLAPEETSPAFPILPVLLRLFNRSSIILGTPNPTPSQVVLPSVQRRPPVLDQFAEPEAPPPPTPAHLDQLREMRKTFGAMGKPVNGHPPK